MRISIQTDTGDQPPRLGTSSIWGISIAEGHIQTNLFRRRNEWGPKDRRVVTVVDCQWVGPVGLFEMMRFRVCHVIQLVINFQVSFESTAMADALVPWFLNYLISIAETYGANISNVPSHAKGKKVQITEVSLQIRRSFACLTRSFRHLVFDVWHRGRR